jgi:hypothetical protein
MRARRPPCAVLDLELEEACLRVDGLDHACEHDALPVQEP